MFLWLGFFLFYLKKVFPGQCGLKVVGSITAQGTYPSWRFYDLDAANQYFSLFPFLSKKTHKIK